MTSQPPRSSLGLLNAAPYGAYAVDSVQTIWFWNYSAERILGHRRHDVLGRQCHQVLAGLPVDGPEEPVCLHGCPSLLATMAGRIPEIFQVRMLCASGERRLVTVRPMIVAASVGHKPVLVHLFHEPGCPAPECEGVRSGGTETEGRISTASLGPRELQVLQLSALGLEVADVADRLGISYHTARKHRQNLRRKLGIRTPSDLLTAARNLGLL